MKRWMILVVLGVLVGCNPIVEPEKEILLYPGLDVIPVGEDWVDGGCDVIINGEARAMTRQTTVDTSLLGETTVKYELDYGIETYQCLRVVKVMDPIAPVLSLVAGVDTIQLGDTYEDPGVVVEDNSDDDPMVTTVSTVDNQVVGTYTITYTATDASGNQTSIVRYVTVRNDQE